MYLFNRRLILLASPFFLFGCASSSVIYTSEPPGAFISGRYENGASFSFNLPKDLSYDLEAGNGKCGNVNTPTATWPDGVTLSPTVITLCNQKNSWVFRKPAQKQFVPDVPAKVVPSIDDAKTKCNQLGFKVGSEAFGNCVLRLLK
jgi:hypothetical protein